MLIKKGNRVISLVLVMLLYFLSVGFNYNIEAASPKPSVSAHSYVVMDADSGEIMYSQDENKRIYPAGTVKMMTALVAIENSSLSKKITVRQSVLSGIVKEATQVGLKEGSTYTLEELLNMLLLYSAADAADTIADAVGGSKSQFIKLMNEKAQLLGMNSTSFDNAIGLDYGYGYPNTYSTANDIAKLTRYAMSNTTIRQIVAKPSYTINNFNNGSPKKILNSNSFLTGQWYPKDLYKIIGTKTGDTPVAGYALAATAIDNKGHEVICAFFGDSTRVKMYEDIESLLIYTFKNFSNNEIEPGKDFHDIKDHWAKTSIVDFVNKGYISGYDDYTFRPNAQITRAEFVGILNNVFGLTKSSGKVFSDTNTHWAKNAIDIAVTNGVCNGKSATEFKPNDPITREEVSVMVSNCKKLQDTNHDKLNNYSDKNTVSPWAKDSVEGMIENGYMVGYSDNTFKSKNKITRAEAVATLSRVN